jgi:hypothetical protein
MSFRLEAHARPQAGEASSIPRLEKQKRQYSHVAESLWDNLDFIQAGCHISQYVSASINTKAEREQIEDFYSS